MTRKTQRDWFTAGIHLLAEQGIISLKIDTLTKRLGVTKGSFYHHFQNYQDYKTKLLEFIMEEGTLQIIQLTDEVHTPEARLNRLLEITTGHPPDLEVALRAWALQDAQVRQHQTKIDERRIAYVRDIFAELGHNEIRALQMAQLLYAVYIGSQQILPPIQETDLQKLYFEMMPLLLQNA